MSGTASERALVLRAQSGDRQAFDALLAGIAPLERLVASLETLSPASRAVITLHYLEELPLSEVAAVLDLSLGTVKSRLSYGLAHQAKRYFYYSFFGALLFEGLFTIGALGAHVNRCTLRVLARLDDLP